MLPVVLSLVLAAGPEPVLVEAGATTNLGRRLCRVKGDESLKLVDGRLVVPDGATPSQLGVEVGDCAAPQPLQVAVVSAVPREPVAAWVYPEEGRVMVRGPVPPQSSLWWRTTGGWKSEPCAETTLDGAAGCVALLPPEVALAAAGGAPLELLRLPPGTPPATGAPPELWPATGTGPASLELLRVPVQRFVLNGPLLRATSLEAWREQGVVPLAAAGVVTVVNCRPPGCWLADDQASVLVSPPAMGDAVTVTARLREKVVVRQGDGFVAGTVAQVLPIARCQVRPLITTVLGGAEDHRLPLGLGDRCPSDLGGLSVETTPPSAAYIAHVSADGKRVEVRLGQVPRRADQLEVRLLRASTRATVGTARVDVRSGFRPTQMTLHDATLGEVPFIPVNREVRLQWAVSDRKVSRYIVPEPAPGYYALRQQDGETWLRGQLKTAGTIPIRFAYVDPASGSTEPLAVFESDVHFAIRAANVPVSLAPEDSRTAGLFTVLCRTGDPATEREVSPGELVSLPYSARGSCRLRVDRSALAESDGTQRIRVTAKITSPSGTSRSGGFSQVLVLSAGTKVDSIWLGANDELRSYDHLSVSIAHDDAPGHYLDGEVSGLPARRYQMVFGDAHLRLYGSATVPTGLYRITRGEDAGLLQFSAGALFRLAVLDREGREFPVDFEFAVLGTNLSGHADFSIVAGIGITVPLLNAQEAAQAALGIHAWIEYSPTRSSDLTRPWAIIIGPSISLGDIGINL